MNTNNKLIVFLLLSTLGVLGNIYNLELFFGINQIFGSIFVLIAVWLFGQWLGILCAIVVHAYTISLWGHPYAWISFVLEAGFVGFFLNRKTKNLFIADIIYWLFIGMPLVYVFYGLIMQMDALQVITIMLKQPANGLFNALVAGLVVYYFPIEKVFLKQNPQRIHFQHILLMLIMGFTILSLFLSTNMIASHVFKENLTNIQQEITHFSRQIANNVILFKQHASRTMSIYHQLYEAKGEVHRMKHDCSIETLYVRHRTEKDFKMIAYKNLSHQPLPSQLISSDMIDSIQFLPDDPNHYFLTTQYQDMIFLGIYNLSSLLNILNNQPKNDIYQSVIVHENSSQLNNQDRETDPAYSDTNLKGVYQNRFQYLKGARHCFRDNLYILFPENQNLPKMIKWKKAHMVYEIPCIGKGFYLAIKQSLAPMINDLQQLYIFLFSFMLLLIVIATFFSALVSRRLESSIQALSDETTNLPDKILNQKQLFWPDSQFIEMHSLITNIQSVASTLNDIFKDAENRYMKIFTGSTDAIFVVNQQNYRIIEANQQAEKLTGVDRLSVMNRPIDSLFDTFAFDQKHQQVEDFNANIMNQASQKIPVQIRVHPMRLRQQDVLCFVVKNIQAFVKMQEQLHLSAKVFETTQEGILITDANKKILLVNKAFETITGYSTEEMVGKDPKVMSSGFHDRAFYQSMWRSIYQEGMWQGEIHDRRKNGETYIQLLSIYSVKDNKGKLTNYIGVFMDVTEQREAQQRIRKLTLYDSLTDLPNRTLLMTKLSNAISVARQNKLKLGLLLFDMDNFKNINDSFGHRAGDLLLKQMVNKLKPETKSIGTMARVGADIFAIIIEKLEQTDALAYFAQKILSVFDASFIIENEEVYTSASIGICLYPDDAQTAEKMIQFADTAMHRAKDLGKKRFEFYTQALNEQVSNKISIETALRKAIQGDQLTIYYQPQVKISSGKIIGCEALLRWIHPEKGFIPPDLFIPIAEESGLIGDIEEWLLHKTAQQIKKWRLRGMTLMMSVNISNYQFMKSNFVELTKGIIESEQAQCDWFELELTERIIMDHKEVVDKLDQLKAYGFQLALDDFGTGHSSLAYLKKFNIDKLKIDKSFIQDLPDDSQSRDIVRAIVSLADSLHMASIAEGAETEGQLAFLRELACESYQGYYFSKPIPVDAFESLIAKE